MSTLNEVKEQMVVVGSVGDFTNALQQIATIRMIKLREKVLRSRPFVEAANEMLRELVSLRSSLDEETLMHLEGKHKKSTLMSTKRAVIIITSNAGLIGRYNIEIYQKVEKLLELEKDSDFYVIGKKGQEYYQAKRFKIHRYPYEVQENFTIKDLQRLINLFDYYSTITLVYSRYINSATRDVVTLSVVNPTPAEDPAHPLTDKEKKRLTHSFIYEPDIIELIDGVSKKLRAALFQQQILDGRLSQFSAQMIGMKTASDNANNLLADLRVDYNKQRRKLIDKKISEVFAGSALW